MIEFKEITKDNLNSIIDLTVEKHQEDQVAPNSISIAQGCYSDEAWFRGIFAGETPVGFIMLSLDEKEGMYGVWRFMIDKNHQGKGYGKAALLEAIRFMKTIPGIQEIHLSYVPKENDGADGFYKKVGFVDTGELTGKEVIMKYIIEKSRK